MPTDDQADAIQRGYALLAEDDRVTATHFAELERKRIVHCCQLETLKESDRADQCVELLRELSQ